MAENRQIRESTAEILRSEFRSKNNTGQQKLIYHRKLYHSTFYMPRIGSFGPFIRIKYNLELNHVIRVAVNKHVFGETKFTYLASPRRAHALYKTCRLKTWQDGRQGIKLTLETIVFFIQIHLWRKK